jgi:hypothetical protein
MPVFDFTAPAGHSIARGTFWIYWAITAPLTFFVLAMYFAYSWYTERRLDLEDTSSGRRASEFTNGAPPVTGTRRGSPSEVREGAGMRHLRRRFQRFHGDRDDVEVATVRSTGKE